MWPKAIRFNVRRIYYLDQLISMPQSYGTYLGGYEGAHADLINHEVIISQGMREARPFDIVECLEHEAAGHLTEPRANFLLTRFERLDLMLQLIWRIKSPDRFRSIYVENISSSTGDVKEETFNKAVEYWAEIFSGYLHGGYINFSKTDQDLIEGLLKKTADDEFDFKKYNDTRHILLESWNKRYLQEHPPQK